MAQPQRKKLIAAYLAGGLTISITLGCVIVFALGGSGSANSSSDLLSWSADLAVGGLILLLAVALATRADERYRTRRAERREAKGKAPKGKEKRDDQEPWSQRILAKGSAPIVFLAALAINLPGAAYLIGLKDIATGNYATGEEVALIVGFNLIMFLFAEIPLAGLVFAPEATDRLVTRTNDWLKGNGRQIAIVLCAILGVFLVIRGIVNS